MNNPKPDDVGAFLALELEAGNSIGDMFKDFREEWPVSVVAAILYVCRGLQALAREGNEQAAQVLKDYEDKYPGVVHRVTENPENNQ